MVERKVCHVGKEVVGLWSGSLEGESAGAGCEGSKNGGCVRTGGWKLGRCLRRQNGEWDAHKGREGPRG